MDSIPIWVFLMAEVATDGGLCGHYWLRKQHQFPTIPPLGYELDYRSRTKETVILDRILGDPETGDIRGFQSSWISIGVGDLALWEHAGWSKVQMTDDEVRVNGATVEEKK